VKYNRAAIIGIGLIGGSFALAAKRAGIVETVVGVARSDETLQAAVEIGAADEVTSNPAEAVRGAELVYIAVPVGATRSIFGQIRDSLEPGVLITDAGSTKREVMQAAAELLPNHVTFIGGHPMAGSEQSGVQAAQADLFQNAVYFLTATQTTSPDELDRMQEVVRALGAIPSVQTADVHDRLAAATSHLPHLVSASLASTVAKLVADSRQAEDFLGTGFSDMTRLAEGSPEVWRDILLSNADNLGDSMEELMATLQALAVALQKADSAACERLLTEAQQARRRLSDQ